MLPGPHGAPEHLTEDGVAAAVRRDLDGRPPRRPHRRPAGRPGAAVGAQRRRRGRAAPVEHPRQRLPGRRRSMLSGDTPVIVGPTGRASAGSSCPAVVVRADRWKLAQLRPGDTVRLRAGDPGSRPTRPRRAARAAGRPRRGGRGRPGRGAAGRRPSRRRPARARCVGRCSPSWRPTAPGRGSTVRRGRRPPPAASRPGRPSSTSRVRVWVHLLAQRLRALRAAGGRGSWSRACGRCWCRSTSGALPLPVARGAAGRAGRRGARPGGGHAGRARGAPAARAGRPRDPRGDGPLRAVGARRRAVVPGQHRVHPPDQRPRRPGRRVRRGHRGQLPGARPRRRLPRRAGRRAARPAAPAGDHEVQPGPHLDAGERRRHRRRLPVHLRHGGPRRLPVRRPHRAGLAARAAARRSGRGCCGSSTGCASSR